MFSLQGYTHIEGGKDETIAVNNSITTWCALVLQP